MNYELIFVAIVIVLLFAAKTVFWMKLKRNDGDDGKFVWQPDLSHKVVVSEQSAHDAGRTVANIQQTITLVEKSPEERAEDRRTYLKERR